MNQAILKKLKNTPELSPDVHDGSYELVRTVVSAYRDVDEATLDYQDLNAIYLMCIGTWRHSYDKKHEAVHATHLPEVRKRELDHLIDDLKSRGGRWRVQAPGKSGLRNWPYRNVWYWFLFVSGQDRYPIRVRFYQNVRGSSGNDGR